MVGFTETNKSLNTQESYTSGLVVLPNKWMDDNGPGVVEVAYDGPP